MQVFLGIGISGNDSSPLGKVDKHSLSQQTLMELFIEGMENKEIVCGSKDEPNEISEWKRVTLNENSEVIEIMWYYFHLNGTADLELTWLPSTVQNLVLDENNLRGSIDLTSLPEQMEEMSLSNNRFSGTVSLESLPEKMKLLDLHGNAFSGTVSLTKLPESLENLDISGNEFTGSIDVTSLPINMKFLSLRENDFTGETDLSQLPETLGYFNVSNTQLSGEIYVEKKKWRNFTVLCSYVKRHIKD